jgi:DNA-binding NtrC family response regulator
MRRPPIELDPDVQARLVRYAWPGNVRELRNILERAIILATGDVLTVEHLPPELEESTVARADDTTKASSVSLPAEGLRLEEVERDLVRQALENTGGNQVRAARLLGISRDALRNRMKKFGFVGS